MSKSLSSDFLSNSQNIACVQTLVTGEERKESRAMERKFLSFLSSPVAKVCTQATKIHLSMHCYEASTADQDGLLSPRHQWRGHGGYGGQLPPHFCQKMVLEILPKSKRKWRGIGLVKIIPRNGRMRLRN